jgi:phospholipid-binding lipoprotein MlaA
MRVMPFVRVLPAAALCAGLVAACAVQHPGAVRPDYDPIEPVNRKIFWFNDTVDTYVLEPVATGWNAVVPRRVRRSLSNFFTNLRFPIVATNDLLQGKLADAAGDVGRFAVNTTAGVLGFFDPASGVGLEAHEEDFGQTLGRWGVPPGPYLVLPFLGPSDARDAAGLGADYALSVTPFFVDQFILLGARVGDVTNERSLILKEVRNAKAAAFDYYVFVRNAYIQRRRALVRDDAEASREQAEDLYSIEPNE